MESLAQRVASPELIEADALLSHAISLVQKIWQSGEDGKLSLANRTAGLELTPNLFEAWSALQKADYARVHAVLSWAKEEAAV